MGRFKFGKKKSTDTVSMTSERNSIYTQRSEKPKDDQSIKESLKMHENGVEHHYEVDKTVPLNAVSPWKRFKLLNSPFPRYRHAACAISSEKSEVFLMGGLKEGSVFGDTWKIYPETSRDGYTYQAQPIDVANLNNPPARVGHSAVLCGNAFIVFGGDTVDTDFNGFPDNNFYLFNINNNKYTIPAHINNKPTGRYGHTIAVIALNNTSSRLFLFGGQLENDVFADLYSFELNTFKSSKASWEPVEPVNNFRPPPLTNHSVAVHKTKMYVFGGVYNNERVSNDLWCYDAVINKWSQIPTSGAVPLPVNEHSSCIVGDKLFIYGGNDFSGVIYNSLHVLDLRTFVWCKLADGTLFGPGPRCGHSMTYLPKHNKIVIMGGDKNDYVSADESNMETYEEYDGNEAGTMLYELDVSIVEHFFEKEKKPKSSRYEKHGRSQSAGIDDFRTPLASPKNSNLALSVSERANGFASESKEIEVIPDAPTHKLEEEEDDEKRFESGESNRAVSASASAPGDVSTLSISDPRVKLLLSELTSELTTLKTSTKTQMQNATERIRMLEEELKSQRSQHMQELAHLEQQHADDTAGYQKQLAERDTLVSELKKAVEPGALDVDSQTEGSISELSRYKLDRLELNNRLLYYEQENARLSAKLAHFEPFMNNQIGELTQFQKVIRQQEDHIEKLSAQVVDQEVLQRQLNDLKARHDNLAVEYANFKAIHEDLIEQDHDTRSLNGSTTKRNISSQLEALVNAWNTRANAADKEGGADAGTAATGAEADPEIVQRLQKQIDDLLVVSKQNDEHSSAEIERLNEELAEKLTSLKSFEENYRDALQSVNNTSKALKLNEEELRSQKQTIERLIKENNELNLFVKASKRHSSRSTPATPTMGSLPHVDEEDENIDEESAINNARFTMKIQDLEADLYILKQERDSLKESVVGLQKELYLARN